MTGLNVDDSGLNKDKISSVNSSITTLEPFETNIKENIAISSIIHAKPIPLDWSFDIIYAEFSRFGVVKEIRNRLGHNYHFFDTWIFFNSDKEALNAYNKFLSNTVSVEFAKIEDVPHHLDIYRPVCDDDDLEISNKILRHPDPPKWLIMSTHERGNLFRVKKLLDQKLGLVKRPDVSRFGRNSFLIHTKSDGQSVMLSNLKLESEGLIREIKPHYNFSYARGVIFNEDIYELTEDEILAMCPEGVWKIYKVPRSSMIIITFKNSTLPSEIVLDCEIVRIRPYKPRVLQCFTCFGFGHASRVCTRSKICALCSQPEHGDCSRPKVCVNCKEEHHARDKNCKVLKREQEALMKSIAEHISIGHAKKLLFRNTFSDVVKMTGMNTTTTCSVNTVTAVSGAPSGGASRVPSGGTPRVSSGGAFRAPSGGAPRATSGGASRATSGGALRTPLSGASQVSLIKTSNSSLEVPKGSTFDIQYGLRDCVGPRACTGSLNDLDSISLPGSLPDIEPSPDLDVVVHRTNDGKEMEALSVRQKRARTPSPHSSSRSSSCEKLKQDNGSFKGPLSKKSAFVTSDKGNNKNKEENPSNKVSLSRSLIPRITHQNRITTNPK